MNANGRQFQSGDLSEAGEIISPLFPLDPQRSRGKFAEILENRFTPSRKGAKKNETCRPEWRIIRAETAGPVATGPLISV